MSIAKPEVKDDESGPRQATPSTEPREDAAPARPPHAVPRAALGLHLVALAMTIAAGILLVVPFWPYLVLALWVSGFAEGMVRPVVRVVGGRRRAAAVVALMLLLAVVIPVVLVLIPITQDAITLARRTMSAGDGRRMLEALVSSPGAGAESPTDWSLTGFARLASTHGTRAWEILRTVAGATSRVVAGIAVFVLAAYVRLAHGAEVYGWVERHVPVQPKHLRRVTAAFTETGRGLFVGMGGAAIAQATIATIVYAVAGIPHALLLGALTFLAAIVPGVGSALVWVPLAIGLALTGRPQAAIAIGLLGLLVIGTIDNILKPHLARYGKLRLPASVVFVALLGGVLVMGPSGLLLGPIVVRVAMELVVIAREEREALRAR
jgi:predicted PurR-regulated permease PerM